MAETYLGENAPLTAVGYRALHDGPTSDVTPTTPLPVGFVSLTLAQLQAASAGPSLDTSFGTANAHTSKAAAGAAVAFVATNVNAAVRYLQLHNKATTPVNTDVPLLSIPIPATTGIVQLSLQQLLGAAQLFSTGVSWAVSTTNATLTLATAADHNVWLWYL